MAQAKGILPTRGDDREVLYKNPRMCGYFIGVMLRQPTPGELETWLDAVNSMVDILVEREAARRGEDKGPKIASAVVGLGRSFFDKARGAAVEVESPVGFRDDAQPAGGLLPGTVSNTPAPDVLFYVSSVYEARVNEFMAALDALPLTEILSLQRGYQRTDDSEPFGYKDGVRNIRRSDRSRGVFVDVDRDHPDEPRWADGGSYMVAMKIIQKRETFAALADDAARDSVIGRRKNGSRLDLPENSDPHTEGPMTDAVLPPLSSHVRKVGPRGVHDDTVIFRRGLPFFEVEGGQVRVGLHFCSFQANPAQFDTVFNDWMRNQGFPANGVGADALQAHIDFQTAGLFFVPPYNKNGLRAALTPAPPKKPPASGRLAITKFVVDPSDGTKRFERGGFTFHLESSDGTRVEGSEFTTKSSGRGVCGVPLPFGPYTLVEDGVPDGLTVAPVRQAVVIDRPNVHQRVDNQLQGPTDSYGNRIPQ